MSEGTDRAEEFIVRGDFLQRDGSHSDRYVEAEAIRLQPEAAARTIHHLLNDLDEAAQDVLSLADKVTAIERMHPAGVSPPHELGTLPALCAGCDVYTTTDDDPDDYDEPGVNEVGTRGTQFEGDHV